MGDYCTVTVLPEGQLKPPMVKLLLSAQIHITVCHNSRHSGEVMRRVLVQKAEQNGTLVLSA